MNEEHSDALRERLRGDMEADAKRPAHEKRYMPAIAAMRVAGDTAHALVVRHDGQFGCTCGYTPGLGEVALRSVDRHLAETRSEP